MWFDLQDEELTDPAGLLDVAAQQTKHLGTH